MSAWIRPKPKVMIVDFDSNVLYGGCLCDCLACNHCGCTLSSILAGLTDAIACLKFGLHASWVMESTEEKTNLFSKFDINQGAILERIVPLLEPTFLKTCFVWEGQPYSDRQKKSKSNLQSVFCCKLLCWFYLQSCISDRCRALAVENTAGRMASHSLFDFVSRVMKMWNSHVRYPRGVACKTELTKSV